MVPFDKDPYWEKYTEYTCVRDSRKADSGDSADSSRFFCPVPSETSDLRVEPREENKETTSSVPDSSPAPDTSVARETRESGNLSVIKTVLISALAVLNTADMLGVCLLSRRYVPLLSGKIFSLLRLDTIDPSVWDSALCLNIICCAVAFVISGFLAFTAEKPVSKLIIAIEKKTATVILTAAMPVSFCIVSLIISLAAGFTAENLAILFSMLGGLFYLVLARINLDIPVDSNKL